MRFYLFISIKGTIISTQESYKIVKTPGCSYDLTETLRTYADEVCLQMFVY